MNRRTTRAKAEPEAPEAAPDAEAVARIASLETEVREVRSRLDDVMKDRDAWREQARSLSEIRPRGFFSRLFR